MFNYLFFRTFAFLTGFFSLVATHPSYADDMQLAGLFAQHNLRGTLVIESIDGQHRFVHNQARSGQRFVPASTFKIPHTLIALQEMAVHPQEILLWDGQQHPYPPWNRNHTLASAFKYSCVWCFQELAKRLGPQAYGHYLQEMAYGTAVAGPKLTNFWLQGDLKISAKEQIAFLRKLYLQQLPFSPQHFSTLKQIMQVEKTEDYQIYAKTGWAAKVYPQVGWYVGYVVGKRGVWMFALNMKVNNREQLSLRKSLVMEALRLKKIQPAMTEIP
ncbi:class D beta-lactamase [Magnetococcus sp. PR-3]|uniref:class D beta-lactamase n=1 Tax=Magnetococcus sp. PR-3 TaxID=3120355 RepID=UPI002FCE5AF2